MSKKGGGFKLAYYECNKCGKSIRNANKNRFGEDLCSNCQSRRHYVKKGISA